MFTALARLAVAALISISLCYAADTPGRRVALVSGNGNYQHPDLPKLPNPPNDAEDIAKALRGFGFDVIERKNLTLEGMSKAIAEFGSRIGGSEAALFYFAGHGIQVKNQNYLIPVNAAIESEASVPFQGINVNQVLEEMDNAKSHANIVMLDACRNNPISGKFRSGATRGLASPGGVPKGTVIVYATDPGNVASDGPGRNGLFTAGLLTALKGADLSLDGVLTVASAEVEKASGQTQTPYVNGPKTLQKNFHFRVTVNPGRDEIERTFWASIEQSRDPADFQAYLKKYPRGNFAALAENRLARLIAEKRAREVQETKPVAPQTPPVAAAPAIQQKAPTEPERAKAAPPAAVLTPGKTFKDCPDCPEMIILPAGAFEMGAHPAYKDRESEVPRHRVSFAKPFAIGKTEVTRGQFAAFVKESNYAPAAECWIFKSGRKWERDALLSWRNPGHPQQDSHPATCVTWHDAIAYTKWLSRKTGKEYRLPSEAEWEYAARAGTTAAFPWGGNQNLACDYANVMDFAGKQLPVDFEGHKCNDQHAYTAPVASFKPNDFGLHDMIGNVSEWTQDCENPNYKGAPSDGSAWTQGDCTKRMRRGGSWYDAGWPNRASGRLPVGTKSSAANAGFRPALTIR